MRIAPNRRTLRERTSARAGAAGSGESPRRQTVLARTMLWATLAICLALLIATAGEALTRAQVESQAAAARAHNAAVQRDLDTTQHAAQEAQSPEVIEREARAWGYIRPGEHPAQVVVTPAK